MDERELLILGLLKAQSQHGYQINEFIERNLGRVSDMKKSTAYTLLKRLDHSGYVEVTVEQEGNRPPKMVYSITSLGKKKFEELLKSTLVEVEDVTPAGDIGIMFLDHLPPEDILSCLQERLKKVNTLIQMYEKAPQHGHGIGVDMSMQHRIILLLTDRDWLSKGIEQVSLGLSKR